MSNDNWKSSSYKEVEGYTDEQLVSQIGTAQTDSQTGRTAQYMLINRLVNNLGQQIEKLNHEISSSSKEQATTGKRLYWLNIILVVATLVMAVDAGTKVYDYFFKNSFDNNRPEATHKIERFES